VFDFIETIPKYQRILIICVLLVVIFIGYYYFLIKPQHERITELNSKIDSLNTQIQSINAVASQLSEVQSLNEELKRKIIGLSRILPDTADMDDFLREIVAKASEAGLTIVSFIPQGEKEPILDNPPSESDKDKTDKNKDKAKDEKNKEEGPPYMELPIQMKAQGTYDQVADFCDKVSKIPRIVNINDMKLKLNQDAKGIRTRLIDISYTATTFRSTETLAPKEEEEQKETNKEEQEADKNKSETKNVTAEEHPTYHVGEYRDPFLSPLQQEAPNEDMKKCEGFECLTVTDITLTGIIRFGSGFNALIHGNDGIGYLVKEGDKLFDGRVKSVNQDFAVFSKEVKDVIRNRVFEIERVLYISNE
jgi:type IV pilus assembly protein PilO